MAQINNFPGGFAEGITIRNVPIAVSHPGKVFWVSNASTLSDRQIGGSDSNKGTFDKPFRTLDFAMTQCVGNRGDIIMIKPGHAETLVGATQGVWSVAGVAVIGLGTGDQRPTFTIGTSGANTDSVTVSAANVSVQNCIFIANFLTIAACFTLTTAKNFSVAQCTFRDTSAALNFANIVKSTGAANTADGLTATDNLYGSIGTTFNTFILSAAAINEIDVRRNVVISAATTDVASLIVIGANALTNGFVFENVTKRANTTNTIALISGGSTTSTTIAIRNLSSTLDGAGNVMWTVTTGIVGLGNAYTGAIAGQGFPIPALDS
jgi:hypothetical protein